MNVIILDNGEKGTRLATSWTPVVFGPEVVPLSVLPAPPAQPLDASVIHYSDFSNGTYRPNDLYCFLQGLYARHRGRFAALSTAHAWRSYMVSLTEANDEYWNQTWFDFGRQCGHALFFTDGGEGQFDRDFREIVSVLQSVEIRVGYCYPIAEAQDRLRRALSGGRITAGCFYGINIRLDSANNLLHAFLPLDIALQLADLSECRDEASRLTGRSDEVSELLSRAWHADDPLDEAVRGTEDGEKVSGLLARLLELAGRALVARDAAALGEIFGLPAAGESSNHDGEPRLHELGFHRTFENLRDRVLEHAGSE